MHTPFTQTDIWAAINQHHNQLEPVMIKNSGISCLFGFDALAGTWTSFGGPVIAPQASKENLKIFLEEVLSIGKRKKVKGIHFRALAPMRQWPEGFENEFQKLGFQQNEWKTMVIDLSHSDEHLLKSFDHSARKGIKKAISLGVHIELCNTFETYYENFLLPYLKTVNRASKKKDIYKKCWELDTENIYRHWIARSPQGEILGFLGTYRYDSVATEIMSALTPLSFKQKIPVQDLLHWEIIKYHKDLGDKYFDLAGFNPTPMSEKEMNIRRFKEKWGGKVYDVSSYTLDTRSVVQKIISRLKSKLNV